MKLFILSGGSGKRLWPLSSRERPKQFIKFGEKTLIRMTFERFSSCSLKPDETYVVTSTKYTDLVKEEIPEIPDENILKEPLAKNTAPAVMFALVSVVDDDIFIISPSDHLVRDREKFCRHLKKASEFLKVNKNALLTFGIEPDHPEDGYGYIKIGDEVLSGIFKVERFVEKPSIERAKEMLQEGKYLWNSGIFMGYRSAFLKAFEKFAPDVAGPFMEFKPEIAYEKVNPISIDYAVMEKADNLYVLKSDFDWTDVGSWLAIEKLGIEFESSKTILEDSENVFLISDVPSVIIGLKDVIVVNTSEGLLVASKKGLKGRSLIKIVEDLNKEV